MRTPTPWLCACAFAAVAAYPADDLKTLDQLRKEAMKSGPTGAQPDGSDNRPKLGPIQAVASTPTRCPDPVALDLFRHQIAYQRTEELDPLKDIQELHADVWERGPLTAFYVRERLSTFIPGVRMTYLFGEDGPRGRGTCPVEKNWRACVEGLAGMEFATNVVGTCTTTIDMRAIPPWEPTPDGELKRRVADELRNEIEAEWQGVQEVVIHDFNLKDSQITMYLRMPDGDYFQGCGFHATREPHCGGWHLFGQVPASSIRKFIFDRPYRLK